MSLNLIEIKEALLFANVPYFLFKKIKNSSICLALKTKLNINALEAKLNNIDKKNIKEINELAFFYSIIGALYLHNYDFRKINLNDFSEIYWFPNIVTIILEEEISTTETTIKITNNNILTNITHAV